MPQALRSDRKPTSNNYRKVGADALEELLIWAEAQEFNSIRSCGVRSCMAGAALQAPSELYPDQVVAGSIDPHLEGALHTVTVNAYERNSAARAACLRHHGYRCSVCSFDFWERFGELGREFIHVHHLRELSGIRAEYVVDPIADLRPVCPNCHAMLHRRRPALSIEALRAMLEATLAG